VTIESPATLLALTSLIPILALQIRTLILGRRDILRLGRQWPSGSVTSVYLVKWFFSTAAFNLFVVLTVLAAADITWGQEPIEEDRTGLDVVMVVDVSRSMLASDTEPSRLQRSVGVMRGVGRQMTQARVAVVAFKGDAVTLMPMTEDITAVEVALDIAGPSLISAAGTDLNRGLVEALDRFPAGTGAHRAVVLFSDGEALTGSVTTTIARARREGIPVLTVVAGTAEGAVVPGADGPLLDEQGRPVISRADPRELQQVASMTGGTFHSVDDPSIVADLSESLERFADIRETEGFRLGGRRRFRLFLGAGLAALAVSVAIRVVRWRDMF
jgi:Ca-activated chloride channel family protein